CEAPFETVNTVDGLADAFVSVKLPVDAVLVKVNVRLAFTAPLARVSVTLFAFAFAESPIVIVGSVVDKGKLLKVAEAFSGFALVVRFSVFAGLVLVIVKAVALDVGEDDQLPLPVAVT